MTWDDINAAGIVFLPAAGSHNGSGVYNVGDYGYYLSSSAFDGSDAYVVRFSSDDVTPGSHDRRLIGYSVRLITDSK